MKAMGDGVCVSCHCLAITVLLCLSNPEAASVLLLRSWPCPECVS